MRARDIMTRSVLSVQTSVPVAKAAAMLAKRGSFSMNKDNHDPRRWLANQTGWRARANAAQANSYEVLPFFIGLILGDVAIQTFWSAFASLLNIPVYQFIS